MNFKPGKKTLLMGIINVTPDSFYDGGRYYKSEEAINRAYKLYEDGADIIDIGGESTRPGSKSISVSEEIDRVCPVIEKIARDIDITISIDTYKAKVAEEALKLGATIVNDISGLSFDESMAEVIAKYNSHVILMHIKGTPDNMQINPQYENLLKEIYSYLEDAKNKAIENGIDRDKIIIDPGIGFGKSLEDNYKILLNIAYFKKMGFPILIGLSRKSLITKLNNQNVNSLYATIALNSISIINGADIIRVHDIEEHRLTLPAIEMLKKTQVSNGSCL